MPIERNRLPAIMSALPGAMQTAVHEIGDIAAENAHQLVRKDTGSLDETIGVDPSSLTYDGQKARIVVCAGDTSGGYHGRESKGQAVDYAQVQEFGGAHTPAQPFMGPAAQQAIEKGPQKAAAILRTVVL